MKVGERYLNINCKCIFEVSSVGYPYKQMRVILNGKCHKEIIGSKCSFEAAGYLKILPNQNKTD